MVKVLETFGVDRDWSAQAFAAMRKEGLTGVETVVSAHTWPGGSAGARLISAGISQLELELTSIGGLEPREVDRVQELLSDPAVVFHGHRLYSTSGRRPPG